MNGIRKCLTCLCTLGMILAATGITVSARGGVPSTAGTARQLFFRNSRLGDSGAERAPNMQGAIRTATGKITYLCIHEPGSGYGPPSDFMNVEVVIKLDSMPGKAFGFQLRPGPRNAANEGMLQVVRTAFEENESLTIDYVYLNLANSVMLRAMMVPSAPALVGYPMYIPFAQK